MILWRIATETRKYPADDLSGGGAWLARGRLACFIPIPRSFIPPQPLAQVTFKQRLVSGKSPLCRDRLHRINDVHGDSERDRRHWAILCQPRFDG